MPKNIKEEISMVQMNENDKLLNKASSSLNKKLLCFGRNMYQPRTVFIGQKNKFNYCTNAINNQKYNVFTFIPLVLYNQFKFFLNLYFLIVALTQFINQVKIGYLYTYWGPLGFVLTITMFREAIDDFRRNRRDQEVNSTVYTKLGTPQGKASAVTSANIKVGDLIRIEKNQRVPADVVLLRTTECNGSCFIRTDQLDGETDWKPRMAVPFCQSLPSDEDLFTKNPSLPPDIDMSVFAEKPQKDIHTFIGSFTLYTGGVVKRTEPLSIENTLWASSVVASGTALGLVIYTGRETRSVMNTSQPRSKVGLTDLEVNEITKVLFVSVITLSLLLMVLKGFTGPWYRYLVRFILLFSYIIPISLRVNLDLAKMAYAYMIMRDKEIPGNVCRNTTIPEELGRINYLFSDKTGTLTKNEMIFKKLYLGHSATSFGPESDPEVAHLLQTADRIITAEQSANTEPASTSDTVSNISQINRKTRALVMDLYETVKALTICNNVTPVNAPILTGQASSDPFTKSIGLKSPFSAKHPFQTPKLFQSTKTKAARTPVKGGESKAGTAVLQKIVTSTSSELPSPSKVSTNRDSLTESVVSDSTCGSASQLITSVLPSSGSNNDCFDSSGGPLAYQASSPDEVALVTWSGKVGMRLDYRDMTTLKIQTPTGRLETYTVLHLIPFTSEKKRMGIIVREESTGQITFYVKGADTAISCMVGHGAAKVTHQAYPATRSTSYGSSSRDRSSFSASSGSLSSVSSENTSSSDEAKILGEHDTGGTIGEKVAIHSTLLNRLKRGGKKFENIDLNANVTTTAGPGGLRASGHCDWLEEETGNLAREGLRTLVVGKRVLSSSEYDRFARRLKKAELSFVSSGGRANDRALAIARAHALLEQRIDVLGVTGVEDKLQDGVPHALEALRNAGIKIWMLTGDKLETAICIAKSSHLVQRHQTLFIFKEVTDRTQAYEELIAYRNMKEFVPVIISGPSLEVCLQHYEAEIMELACLAQSVVVCRASPTQKAALVLKVPRYASYVNRQIPRSGSSRTSSAISSGSVLGNGSSRKQRGGRWYQIFASLFARTQKCRTCAIGDGGNDVNMIQAAHLGVGIVGREGKQASLAADFSLTQFSHLTRLILVHGRNSYKRTAALSQFIIHRGLIISIMQAVFSAIFFFASIALYQGYLMIGYSTIYTMFPVFSLVLDTDVTPKTALMYPELYKDLVKGRALSYKTFFTWVLISIYQGSVMMFGALLLFDDEFVHVVSITFTALILTELFMVAITIRTWHWLIVSAEMFSLAVYLFSLIFLRAYFDTEFIKSYPFIWKVLVVTLISCLPLFMFKFLARKLSPPIYAKLN